MLMMKNAGLMKLTMKDISIHLRCSLNYTKELKSNILVSVGIYN